MRYTLYIKIKGEWQSFTEFDAADSHEAFRIAIARLPTEHYDKPIALRPHEDGPTEVIAAPSQD